MSSFFSAHKRVISLAIIFSLVIAGAFWLTPSWSEAGPFYFLLAFVLFVMLIAGQVEGVVGIRFTRKRSFRAEEIDLAQALAHQAMLACQLRRLTRQSRQAAVVAERNRMARDIHDTLAQGYVGVSVQLEVLSELLRHNKTEAAARHLDTTRGFVREGLAEARQSIWALRSQDSSENTLPVKLRRLTEQSNGHGIESSFSLFGAYRPLAADTEREFLRVA